MSQEAGPLAFAAIHLIALITPTVINKAAVNGPNIVKETGIGKVT